MDSDALIMLAGIMVGGAELRYAVHKIGRRVREHHVRIAALEDSRRPPSIGADPFGDTPAMQHPVQRFHRLGLVALVVGVFLFGLTGCTQADIDRAEAVSAAADAKLSAADQALAVANQALDEARELAAKVGSDQARQLVAKAQQAVDLASASDDAAKVAAKAGRDAVEGAKAAQAAGASTFNVLLAAATALIPAAGGLIASINSAVQAGRALRQTVAGVDAAKAKLPPDAVDTLHAELAKAQDASTKRAVDQVQAAAAAKG